MDVTLRQLRAFVCLAQTRSFTQAAAALHLSQPALTVQIRNVEAALGARLFDRNSRSVELTRLGAELAPVLRRILRDLDGAVLDVRDQVLHRHGTVRIAALPSFAAGILPEIIARFRQGRPRVAFVVKDAVAHRVAALVLDEAVDLGVTGGPPPEEVEVLRQAVDPMQVVFPEGHAVGAAPRVTVDELARHPLVLMDPDTSVRDTVDRAFAAAGQPLMPAAEATYMMTAVGMVRAGLGIAILPASATEPRAEPSLRCRPVDDPRLARTISVIKKRNRTLPPAADDFLAAILPGLG